MHNLVGWQKKKDENLDFIVGQAGGLVLMDGLFGGCDAAAITQAGSECVPMEELEQKKSQRI